MTPFQQKHAEAANRFASELIDGKAKEKDQGDFGEGVEIRIVDMKGVRGYLLPHEVRELHMEKVDAENGFCNPVDGLIRKREAGKETERENGERGGKDGIERKEMDGMGYERVFAKPKSEQVHSSHGQDHEHEEQERGESVPTVPVIFMGGESAQVGADQVHDKEEVQFAESPTEGKCFGRERGENAPEHPEEREKPLVLALRQGRDHRVQERNGKPEDEIVRHEPDVATEERNKCKEEPFWRECPNPQCA